MNKENNMDGYGLWEVSTEGDCEGKSIQRLGIFRGYLDKIAFALAEKAMYTLMFKRVDTKIPKPTRIRTQVDVCLDLNLWACGMTDDERVKYFSRLLEGRDVEVCHSQNYAAVTLKRTNTEDDEREIALSKLSDREKELLGLNGKENVEWSTKTRL